MKNPRLVSALQTLKPLRGLIRRIDHILAHLPAPLKDLKAVQDLLEPWNELKTAVHRTLNILQANQGGWEVRDTSDAKIAYAFVTGNGVEHWYIAAQSGRIPDDHFCDLLDEQMPHGDLLDLACQELGGSFQYVVAVASVAEPMQCPQAHAGDDGGEPGPDAPPKDG